MGNAEATAPAPNGKSLTRVRVPLSATVIISLVSLAVGVATGLYTARLDLGTQVARQGRQIDVNTGRIDKLEDAVSYFKTVLRPADQLVSAGEHGDLLRQVEINRQNNEREFAELSRQVENNREANERQFADLNGRVDRLTRLLIAHDEGKPLDPPPGKRK